MACIATSHALDQILKGFFKENRGQLYYSKIFIAFLACATAVCVADFFAVRKNLRRQTFARSFLRAGERSFCHLFKCFYENMCVELCRICYNVSIHSAIFV